MDNGIDMKNEFFKLGNFCAYMIWDNYVYCSGDELDDIYVKNHSQLYQEIYNKNIYYVKDNIKRLVNKYKI